MVAAVSIATPAFIIFMAVGMLFGIGGTSMISRMLGEGKRDMAKHISAFCFWTGASIGVIAMIIMTIFSVPVCRLIGASDATIGYASQYLSIVAIGIPFLIVSNSFSNIIRSEGHATVAMTGMIIGNMINIVLDPVMIIGFNGMLQVQLLPQFLVTFSQPYFILSTLLPSGRYYRLNLKIIPLKR